MVSPSAVSWTPLIWRISRGKPSSCSKPSSLRRSTLIDCLSFCAAARKLPQRATSRKLWAASQSGTVGGSPPPHWVLRMLLFLHDDDMGGDKDPGKVSHLYCGAGSCNCRTQGRRL